MAKYLITGGAGFIGSHIAERLLSEGHSVCVLDNFSSGTRENLSFSAASGPSTMDLEIIEGDIRDYSVCLKACEDADAVFHQAALKSVPKSMENPREYNEVNIAGILNMLQAAKERKVRRFVFASSSSVYGNTEEFPQKEGAYPLLISPYALTKLAGEFYCRIFAENYGLETVSLRYFNVFGPRQALDDEYAVVIPKFINCMLKDQSPPIHGTGEQSRDFSYIDNVVDANILAANTIAAAGQVFNVANGKTHSILELVKALNEIMGKSIKPEFTPLRAGDVFKSLADIRKIEKLLGYKPMVNFEEGLIKTTEWFRTHNKRSESKYTLSNKE